jgi:hypothetical protein
MQAPEFSFLRFFFHYVCMYVLPSHFVIQQLEPFVRIRSAIFERLLNKEAELPFKLIPL